MTRLGDLWTLGNFLKTLAAINLPKSHIFLGKFCRGVKIFHFSREIIFGQLFMDIWQFSSGHTGWKSHMASCNQFECFISTQLNYAMLKLVDGIGSCFEDLK